MSSKKSQPPSGQATLLSFFGKKSNVKSSGTTKEVKKPAQQKRSQEDTDSNTTKVKKSKNDFFSSDEDDNFQEQDAVKSRFFNSKDTRTNEKSQAVPKSANEVFGGATIKRSSQLPTEGAETKPNEKTATETKEKNIPRKRPSQVSNSSPIKEDHEHKVKRVKEENKVEEKERKDGIKKEKTMKMDTQKRHHEEQIDQEQSKSVTKKAEINKETEGDRPKSYKTKKDNEQEKSKTKHKEIGDIKEDTMVEGERQKAVKQRKKESSTKVVKEEVAEGIVDGDIEAKPEEPKKKNFWAYKSREGPKALGTREIPKGNSNSFQGMTFVVTGELECIARDDWTDLVKRLGGRVTTGVSKKTDYVIVGRDPGESKLVKAKACGTKQIDEEGFYKLLEDLPAKGDYEPPVDKPTKAKASKKVAPVAASSTTAPSRDWIPKRTAETTPLTLQPTKPCEPAGAAPIKTTSLATKPTTKPTLSTPSEPTHAKSSKPVEGGALWVEKYKPAGVKDIIGHKTQVDRLTEWLTNWKINNAPGDKAKSKAPNKAYGKKAVDTASFKAVLISGPPGIGKTTTATLVASACGYDVIELNASDTRSKTSLRDEVSDVLDNRAMTEFYSKVGGSSNSKKRPQMIIMDEVDGMSAGDRGGMQELIQLIKTTKVPIICLCNDHSSRKVRSLMNCCVDMRFNRPNINQIKGKVMSICFKEGLSIEPNALEQLITATNNDIRQILNQLSVWQLNGERLTYDGVKDKLKNAKKDSTGSLSVFDAVRTAYTRAESDRMNFDEKLRMYFVDDMVPLMSQENYLRFVPDCARNEPTPHRQAAKTLDVISKAADSFCDGDILDATKRRNNAWGLMPNHGVASLVRPAYYMKGMLSSSSWQMGFPSWLGNYSKGTRSDRLLKEIQVHLRTHATCTTSEINQWYLPLLRTHLVKPLVSKGTEGISEVTAMMDTYTLTREDWDTIVELTEYSGLGGDTKLIETKAKSAFTRAYNSETHMLPYAEKAALPKRAAASVSREAFGDGEVVDEESGQIKETVVSDEETDDKADDDKLDNDKMIKAKVSKGAKGAKGTKKETGKKTAAPRQKKK